ncbi:cyclic di-GMP phosphodiesterase [Sulfurospirillum diekertiae]|uniref:Cyclic di-GMP phosphodiesterase n=1 Tax=Sulfurospirillum diekertiae TaxID=1854492 RepID=A0A290HRI4_9BACT|nr:EAL domain-containing protein [Sulfurospirillum diekertiae]ATB68426.1 cyclic di-GMP phosphodiesterase [Sulfurospirillum diekertiae]
MKIAKTYALYSTIILSFTLIFITSVWFVKKTQEESQIVQEQSSVFERYKAVLNLEKSVLRQISLNYSRLDEIKAFINTPDLAKSKDHLEPLLSTFGLHYIFILDASKKQVYTHKSDEVQNINLDLSSFNASSSSLREFYHFENGTFVQFFLTPIYASSHLVQAGNPIGFLLLGRLFDQAFLTNMEHMTLGYATLFQKENHPFGDQHFELPLFSLQNEVIGYLDFNYSPSLLLFMNEFQNTTALIGFIIILSAIVLFYFLTQHIIFIPIKRISMALKSHNLNYIAALSRQKDELGEIAHLIYDHEKQTNLLEHYKEAVDENTIVSKTNTKGIITYANKQFIAISGYNESELLGKPHNIVRHPDNPPSFFKEMWTTLKEGKTWKGVVKNRRKDGTAYYVKSVIMPLFDDQGNIQEYIAIRYDVSELFEQVDHLRKDKLIELPSRKVLLEAIEHASNPHLAILNISGFRDINTLHGQAFGDLYLRHLAITIKQLMSKSWQFFHLHSDEFALYCDTSIPDNTFNDECHHILTILNHEGLLIQNTFYPLSLRCGIANGASYLYNRAEIAMKEARISHKAFVIYDDNKGFEERLQKDIQWNETLMSALKENRFTIFFQEIVPLHVKEPSRKKYEVLIRLIDAKGNIISPYHFIDLSKRIHLYDQLTRFVMQEGFRAAVELYCDISINITQEDILTSDTVQLLFDLLKQYPSLKGHITLELVESEGLENSAEVQTFLQQAKEHGCLLAIDDFGSGYSNFEYLLRLNVDFIKIDGSLIKHLDTDDNAYATVKTIAHFARNLGILVVAEFIHNKDILEKVQELGIEFGQGFYLHEPSPKPKLKK